MHTHTYTQACIHMTEKSTKFLVLRPEYPHAAVVNTRFSIRKGEVLECPEDYIPSSSFLVFESRAAAEKFVRSHASIFSSCLPAAAKPASTSAAEESVSLSRKRGRSPPPLHPLFRRVSSISGEVVWQLFKRDIHVFLSQHESDILPDLLRLNIHKNTAIRLLEHEEQHSRRPAVIEALKAIIAGEKPRFAPDAEAEDEDETKEAEAESEETADAAEDRSASQPERESEPYFKPEEEDNNEPEPKPSGVTTSHSPAMQRLLQP